MNCYKGYPWGRTSRVKNKKNESTPQQDGEENEQLSRKRKNFPENLLYSFHDFWYLVIALSL